MNYTDKFSGKNVKAKRVAEVVALTNVPVRSLMRIKFDDGTHDTIAYSSTFIRSVPSSTPITAGCWYVDGEGYMTGGAFNVRYMPATPVSAVSKSHRYVSHKEVEAYEIARCQGMSPTGYEVHFVGGQSRIVKNEVFTRRWPTAGDFLVIYRDGYVSVSPRSEFLDGYSPKPEPVEVGPIEKANSAEKMLIDLMPGNRWGSIAKTEIEKAFMCVRRALYNA